MIICYHTCSYATMFGHLLAWLATNNQYNVKTMYSMVYLFVYVLCIFLHVYKYCYHFDMFTKNTFFKGFFNFTSMYTRSIVLKKCSPPVLWKWVWMVYSRRVWSKIIPFFQIGWLHYLHIVCTYCVYILCVHIVCTFVPILVIRSWVKYIMYLHRLIQIVKTKSSI